MTSHTILKRTVVNAFSGRNTACLLVCSIDLSLMKALFQRSAKQSALRWPATVRTKMRCVGRVMQVSHRYSANEKDICSERKVTFGPKHAAATVRFIDIHF